MNAKALFELLSKTFLVTFAVAFGAFFVSGHSILELLTYKGFTEFLVKAVDGSFFAAAGVLLRSPWVKDLITVDQSTTVNVVKLPPAALILIPVLFFSGCASDGSFATGDKPFDAVVTAQQSAPVVKFSSREIAYVAMKKAIDKDDLKVKAALIEKVSIRVEGLLTGDLPSVEQFEADLKLDLPDKAHWNQLIDDLSGVYKTQVISRVKGNAEAGRITLAAMVAGLKEAAQRAGE